MKKDNFTVEEIFLIYSSLLDYLFNLECRLKSYSQIPKSCYVTFELERLNHDISIIHQLIYFCENFGKENEK